MRAEVEKIIKIIRPAIQADEGDIDLVDVDEATGIVTVELYPERHSLTAAELTAG